MTMTMVMNMVDGRSHDGEDNGDDNLWPWRWLCYRMKCIIGAVLMFVVIITADECVLCAPIMTARDC